MPVNIPTIQNIGNPSFVGDIMGNEIPFNNTMNGFSQGNDNNVNMEGGGVNQTKNIDHYLNFIELSKIIENSI